MNSDNIFNPKNIKTIMLIAAIAVILGLAISFIQTPKYQASAKLLVIFNQPDMNAYASAQTANYIASILEEVIYPDSFIGNVFKTDFALEDNLGFDPEQRSRNWKRLVKTNLRENKGIIAIDVFHPDRDQANNFAQAISYTLITNNSLYHGSGDNVVVKMIATPNAAAKPTQPNFTKNILLSLLAGIFIGLTMVIIFPEQELLNFIFRKKSANQDELVSLANNAGFDWDGHDRQ